MQALYTICSVCVVNVSNTRSFERQNLFHFLIPEVRENCDEQGWQDDTINSGVCKQPRVPFSSICFPLRQTAK
jgi:hypothetical protein